MANMATEWKAKKKKKKQWMPTMSCTICRVRRSSSRSAAGSQSCKCWMGDKSMPRTFTPLMLQHECAFHWHRWPNSTLNGAWVYIGHWHHWPKPHCMGHECTSVTDTTDRTPHMHGAWVYIGHWHHWPNSTLHGEWVYIGHWHRWPNSTLHGVWVYISHWHHWLNTLHKFTSVTNTNDQTPHCTSSHESPTQRTKLLATAHVYVSHRCHWPNSTLQRKSVYFWLPRLKINKLMCMFHKRKHGKLVFTFTFYETKIICEQVQELTKS